MNLRDVITFAGESVAELRRAFQESVDDYLAFCAARNEPPGEPCSGTFIVRAAPMSALRGVLKPETGAMPTDEEIRQIIAEYPDLEPEDIRQALLYAAWAADEVVFAPSSAAA